MVTLAISLLFFLLWVILFPSTLLLLSLSIFGIFISLVIFAYFSRTYRRFSILIILGLSLASILMIPKLLDYQTAFSQLPQTNTYQFQINKIYSDHKTAEAILLSSDLKNYAIQLYNLNPAELLLENGIYEARLTIQPNHARATFFKINPRLTHLIHHRIGTANLTTSIKLIQNPDALMRIRSDIADYLYTHDFDNSGLMSALSVGFTDDISQAHWDLLRQTGTIHLVSISGLHLTFIALWCFIIIRIVLGFCMVQKPAPYQIAAIASLIIAILYALLAGMSLPTQRALIMFGIFTIALIMRYPILSLQSLATALLIVLIIAPFSVLTIGLWLSFTAVLILILLSKYNHSFIISLLLTQVIISILAMPIVASFFNDVSLISPVANLFAIPWTTLLILPFLLLGIIFLPIFPTFAHWLFNLSDHNITLLMQFLHVMNEIPFSHMTVTYLPFAIAILMTVLALLLLTKIRKLWKVTYFIALIALLTYSFRPNQDEYLLVLPVGEGLSVIIKSQEQTLLFDTGRYFRGYNSADSVILPTLKNLGIQHLDKIILSHNNQQYIGGTRSIRRNFPNVPLIVHSSLKPLVSNSSECQNYLFKSESFEIQPLPIYTSCAFMLKMHDHTLWLIANITPLEWAKLLKNYPKPDAVLFPNKGRSKGYIIPDDWQDVILIASTKTVHKQNQHHNLHNAYYGAVRVNIAKTLLSVQSASDKESFWWVRPKPPI